MALIHTLLLGIVEGLTEFIPVSSTAHLLIAEKILGMRQTVFLETLTVVIQSGAMLAAVLFFWKTVWNNLVLIPKLIVAFIPSAIAGLLFAHALHTLFSTPIIIALALILGGIIFLIMRPIDTITRPIESISYKEAFIIGLSQIVAIIPGISRSGATLIGGTYARIPREMIVSFSFLLAIPTIFGASVVELRHIPSLSIHQWELLAFGTIVSFVVAFFTMRTMLRLMTKKPLAWFGWYRIALGVLLILFLL